MAGPAFVIFAHRVWSLADVDRRSPIGKGALTLVIQGQAMGAVVMNPGGGEREAPRMGRGDSKLERLSLGLAWLGFGLAWVWLGLGLAWLGLAWLSLSLFLSRRQTMRPPRPG